MYDKQDILNKTGHNFISKFSYYIYHKQMTSSPPKKFAAFFAAAPVFFVIVVIFHYKPITFQKKEISGLKVVIVKKTRQNLFYENLTYCTNYWRFYITTNIKALAKL